MCDYSLHAQPNRLAREGEQLILTKFPGGSRGFASRQEYLTLVPTAESHPSIEWTWKGIYSYIKNALFSGNLTTLCAVCLPPGARLRLDNLCPELQQSLGVSGVEEVTFTQLNYEAYNYRDAVRFSNGKELLLQRLNVHLHATVLSIGARDEQLPADLPDTTTFDWIETAAPERELVGVRRRG